jgi:hypothetical protein
MMEKAAALKVLSPDVSREQLEAWRCRVHGMFLVALAGVAATGGSFLER